MHSEGSFLNYPSDNSKGIFHIEKILMDGINHKQ